MLKAGQVCTIMIPAIAGGRLKSFALMARTQSAIPGRGKSRFGSTTSLVTASQGAPATRPSHKPKA